MRRLPALVVALLLVPACGDGGPVVVSDLTALTDYLVTVMEAESALIESAPAGFTATSAAQALEAARNQIEATRAFVGIVAALDPPPEAQADRQALVDLGNDQIDLFERMLDAVDSSDLAAITSLTREALGFMVRSADEAAGRQELVSAALAAHPDRPLNQYLTEIAGLWVPLNADYQRLAADAQRALLANSLAGAARPYRELSERLNAFLPDWEAVAPPAEAAEFHGRYYTWAAAGIGIFDSLLPVLEDADFTSLQSVFNDMMEWSFGVNEILLMRNELTVTALLAP